MLLRKQTVLATSDVPAQVTATVSRALSSITIFMKTTLSSVNSRGTKPAPKCRRHDLVYNHNLVSLSVAGTVRPWLSGGWRL